jgi:hypothetical protein
VVLLAALFVQGSYKNRHVKFDLAYQAVLLTRAINSCPRTTSNLWLDLSSFLW